MQTGRCNYSRLVDSLARTLGSGHLRNALRCPSELERGSFTRSFSAAKVGN